MGGSIFSQTIAASRGVTGILAIVAGVLAWVAQRGEARAGGGTTGAGQSSKSGETTSTSTETITQSTASGTRTESNASGSGSQDSNSNEVETGPCLSIPEPTGGTEEPMMSVCLCTCDTGDEGPDAPTSALLLALLVRRRRRESLEHVAAQGRLPEDVVARLRAELDEDD